jgi:hypothetical protein
MSSLGMGYTDGSYAARNTPEARAELESIRAENKAKAREALAAELNRFADMMLPGSVPALVERHPELGGGTAAERAVRIHKFITEDPLARRYLKPEHAPEPAPVVQFRTTPDGHMIPEAPPAPAAPAKPRGDALRAVLSRYAGDFKNAAMVEKFYAEHALKYSHAEPAEVIAHVVEFLSSRSNNSYLKTPIPPSERTLAVAKVVEGYRHQLRDVDPVELAESWYDFIDPLKPAMRQPDLERAVTRRLKSLPAESFRTGAFDPVDYRGTMARPADQAAEQERAARAHFQDVRI